MRHIIPISGKDSLATAILQTAHEPEREYEYFFNDVGSELPETYEWLDAVEQKTGWEIHRIGKSLEDVIYDQGILPSHRVRFCTRMTKIQPMQEYLAESDALVYYGLRADEPKREGYVSTKGDNIEPTYPLRDMNIDLEGVWTLVKSQDLKPPTFFWDTLYERTLEAMQEEPKLVQVDAFDGEATSALDLLKEWEFDMLFAGRSRSNCYFCFYQRQYEIVWLSETHPELFDRACQIEQEVGADDFTWKQNWTLPELAEQPKKDKIIRRRVRQIIKALKKKMEGYRIGEDRSLMNTTSCGLMCGK